MEYQEDDRVQAIRDVLKFLRHPLLAMCLPDREVAVALVRFHKIEAEELLAGAQRRSETEF